MSAATRRVERSEGHGFPRDCIAPVATVLKGFQQWSIHCQSRLRGRSQTSLQGLQYRDLGDRSLAISTGVVEAAN